MMMNSSVKDLIRNGERSGVREREIFDTGCYCHFVYIDWKAYVAYIIGFD